MKLLYVLGGLAISPMQGLCFHVDSSPERTRKTYLKREQKPSLIRHEDQLPPKAYTDEDRSWRFPKRSLVRPVGDTTLSNMTDQERLWRQPAPNMVRHTPYVGKYLDEDRMWRKPSREIARHENSFPPDTLKDEERLWWKGENFEHLQLEDDEDDFFDADMAGHSIGDRHLFRRPTSKFSRHPRSMSEFDDDIVSTMVEDDSLGWLTESTNKLLMEEEET
jgi:hypothetical protein